MVPCVMTARAKKTHTLTQGGPSLGQYQAPNH